MRHRPGSPPHAPASLPACRPSSYASLSAWQRASTFNQPLSFDISSVTDMYLMFHVRSARALPSASIVGPSLRAACTAAASIRPLAPLPACRPSSHASRSTPQHTDGLSDANKLLIRCAWSGSAAFVSQYEYVALWGYDYDRYGDTDSSEWYESEWSSLGPCHTSSPPLLPPPSPPSPSPPSPSPPPVPRAVLQPRQCVTTADGVSRCIQIQEGLSLDDKDVQAMIEHHFASPSPSQPQSSPSVE